MDAQLESLVELYLTRGGRVFVSPQYDVAYDQNAKEGGSCPDVLALDMAEHDVIVVEVTSSSNLSSLFQRIHDRKARWFSPIMRRLQADRVIDSHWNIRFIGFIRRDLLRKAGREFSEQSDVCFIALEDAAFSFAYWTKRAEGLPRKTVEPEHDGVPRSSI